MAKMTAYQLNKKVERMRDYHETAFTDLHYVQQMNPRIVKDYTERNAGMIRTYEEALKFVEKAAKSAGFETPVYTRETYSQEVQTFYETNREHFNIRLESKRIREGYMEVLEANDIDISGKYLSLKTLREFFNIAKEESPNNSSEMMEKLQDLLDEYNGRA